MIRNVAALLLVTVGLGLVGAQLEVESEKTNVQPISRYFIHFVNDLSIPDLTVHCKTVDNDLGIHRSLKLGDDYQFNFNYNVLKPTVYWCKVDKPNAYIFFQCFWPEKNSTWLRDRCRDGDVGTCTWKFKDGGIYLRNNAANTDELVHTWINM